MYIYMDGWRDKGHQNGLVSEQAHRKVNQRRISSYKIKKGKSHFVKGATLTSRHASKLSKVHFIFTKSSELGREVDSFFTI